MLAQVGRQLCQGLTGVANIGFNPLAKTETTEIAHQIVDNVTFTRGRSTWKDAASVWSSRASLRPGWNGTTIGWPPAAAA